MTPINSYRHLTNGEIEMVRLIFSNAIDYDKVRIYNKGYLPFGLQKVNVAMSPNGNIYFSPQKFIEDFSIASKEKKMWFMHEMTHVWQYQMGHKVFFNGLKIALSGGYKTGNIYEFTPTISAKKLLSHFNMEQQAVMVEEYFAVKYLNDKKLKAKENFFESVLEKLFINPSNKFLLPKY